MAHVLKDQLVKIQTVGAKQNRPVDFVAQAVLFWLEYHLDMSLVGNGWIDNDPEAKALLSQKDATYMQFLRECGLVNLYNRNAAESDERINQIRAQMAKEKAAGEEGKNAALQGLSEGANPYAAGSNEAIAWLYGFDEGSE